MAKKQNQEIEQIVNQINGALSGEFTVVVNNSNQQRIDMTATYRNNTQIAVFYDISAGLYGFQMFNGGCKTYNDFNRFVQMIGIYMYINTEFIPTTQTLANMYGQAEGINTKYQTFSGNKTDGFTAKYEVMGCDHYVFVQEKGNHYLVSRVMLTDNGNSYKTLDSVEYIRTENGYESRLTVTALANKLFDSCLNNNINLTREQENLFVLEYDFITINFEAIIEESVEYHVIKVNDKDTDFVVALENFTDIPALITAVLDRVNDRLPTQTADTVDAVDIEDIEFEESTNGNLFDTEESVIAETSVQEDTPSLTEEEIFDNVEVENTTVDEEETNSVEEPVNQVDNNVVEETVETVDNNVAEENFVSEEEFDGNVNSDTTEQEEDTKSMDTIENIVEEKEISLEETDTIETTQEETETMKEDLEATEIAVRKILNKDGLYALLFETQDKLYTVMIDNLKEYRIPYNRITDIEKVIQKRGYSILETESKKHVFAEDVSENKELIKQLVTALF